MPQVTLKQVAKFTERELSGDRLLLTKDIGCEAHVRCGAKLRHKHHSPPQSWFVHANLPWTGKLHILCPNAHEGELHVGIDQRIKDGRTSGHYGKVVKALIEETFREAAKHNLTPTPTL